LSSKVESSGNTPFILTIDGVCLMIVFYQIY
jgi:hypothetical protein